MFPKESTSLAPGFRFHPTDEELVSYYLRRKICGKPFRFDAISEIDIYKVEPWDLPGKSRLKTRDLEWYFFSVLDKKYGNGSRTNRATDNGYWKTTGKDRAVYHKSQVVGMKKTLVYHSGRAPRGQRTNWVMHEYRLIDEELEKTGIVQDAFVLCRTFQKSGSGPKNGEQYGAPFVEEEWEEDELQIVSKEEAAEEGEAGDDAYLEGNDLEQILGIEILPENVPIPLDLCSGENVACGEETTDSNNDSQKLLVGTDEYHCVLEQSEVQNSYNLPFQYDDMHRIPSDDNLYDLPVQYDDMHNTPVKHEFIGEPSKTVNDEDVNYLLDEPYMDAADNLQFEDGAFLETNDLINPIDADTSGLEMLEEYLNFFDANGEISECIPFYPSDMMGNNEAFVPGQASVPEKDLKLETQPALKSSEQLLGNNDDIAYSSKQELSKECGTDFQYPFLKQASRMLGSIPAPPAFASEYPSKDATLRLNPASSSTAHVSTGMIHIGNIGLGSHGMDWFSGKLGRFNIVLSFGLSRGDDNSTTLESVVSIHPGKIASGMSSGWFYFIIFWVLILSVSFEIGTYICAS